MQPDREDHVWRFAVHAQTDTPVYDDPLIEMVRVFLKDFLDMGFFTYEGKKVQVDGFAFANKPQELYALFEESGDCQDDTQTIA